MQALHSSRGTRPEYAFIIAKIFAGFAFFGSLIFLIPLAVGQASVINSHSIQNHSRSALRSATNVPAPLVGAVQGEPTLDGPSAVRVCGHEADTALNTATLPVAGCTTHE
jgi:hypothetical protein